AVTIMSVADPFIRVYGADNGGFIPWTTLNYWFILLMGFFLPFLLRVSDLQSRLMQFFIIILALQLPLSADFDEGQQHMLGIIGIFGLLIYFTQAVIDEDIWYWIAIISGVLGGVGNLIFFIQFSSLPTINKNAQSLFPLAAIFAVCLGFLSAAKKPNGQLILFLLAGTNLIWVFLSGSRGSLLGGVFCIIFLLLIMKGISTRLLVLGIGTLMALAVVTQFTDFQDQTLRSLDKLFNSDASISGKTSGRSDLALGGWYIFLDNPLGVGTGGFGKAWAQLGYREGLSSFARGIEFPAHSGWIKTLAENGIIGMFFFAAYILSFTISGLRQGNRALLGLGLLTTINLTLMFLSTEFQSKSVWFLAAGVTTLLHTDQLMAHFRDAAQGTPIENIIRPEITDYGPPKQITTE
ncbi:MAG: O-antigen ligase family protein, partial [Chloroflexota bacterium]